MSHGAKECHAGAAVRQRGRDARGVRADLALFRADRRRPTTSLKHFDADLAAERVHAAFEGDARGRRLGRFAFDLTVPGGQVKAAGLTDRRRAADAPPPRPAARDDALADRRGACARRAGAVLWPSAGHDLRAVRLRHGLDGGRDRSAARACGGLRGESIRRAMRGLFRSPRPSRWSPPIYDRVARQTPGMFARSSAWWQDRLLIDQDVAAPRRRRAAMRGAATSTASRRLTRSIASTRCSSTAAAIGHILVVEAMGVSPEATHAIWRFLFGIDWMARVKAHLPPGRSSAAALGRRAAAAEFSRARGHLGAADRCRRGARGALLCVGRRDRHRGGGRILPLERRALARRARRRREDRRAGRSRLRGRLARLRLSRRFHLRGTCARDARARTCAMALLRVPMRCSAPTASPGARRYSDAG